MYTNTSATLYCAHALDRNTVQYFRVVLRDVFWDDNKQSNFLKSGSSAADRATVFIPFSVQTEGKRYVKPMEWTQASLEDAQGLFTLKTKDFLVKGVCGYTHEAGQPISELTKRYDDVITLTSVDSKDFGSEFMRHWQIGGA